MLGCEHGSTFILQSQRASDSCHLSDSLQLLSQICRTGWVESLLQKLPQLTYLCLDLDLQMHAQQISKWAHLPEELLILVIKALIEGRCKSFRAAANLRSTCRAWHAAFRNYPVALACRSRENLINICSAYPRLRSIKLANPSWCIADFSPLESCTQLTHIEIEGVWDPINEMQGPQLADFSHLPKSLKNLDLANLMPIPGSVSHLSNISHLDCVPMAEQEEELSLLLQDLPHLKVVSL